jgi:hypothetical protein
MRFVGSKSNTIGSFLIRTLTGSKSSHFLMVFDDSFVIHSKLVSGVGLEWFKTWEKHNEVLWAIDLHLPLAKEEEIYQSLLNENDEKDYDYLAFVYWPFALIEAKLLGQPLASRNPWGTRKGLLCTGLYAKLPSWLVGKVDESQLEMTNPDKLGEIIKERLKIIQEGLCQ